MTEAVFILTYLLGWFILYKVLVAKYQPVTKEYKWDLFWIASSSWVGVICEAIRGYNDR